MTGARIRGAAGAAALLVAAGAALGYAFLWSFPGQGPVGWAAGANTIYLDPVNLAPGSWYGDRMREAIADWNDTPGQTFRFAVADGFHDSRWGDLDGFSDAYFLDLSKSPWPNAVGITYIYITRVSDDHPWGLFDGDIAFDKRIFLDGTHPQLSSAEFRRVARHELGHNLGLGHAGYIHGVWQVMTPGAAGPAALTQDDEDGMRALYPAPAPPPPPSPPPPPPPPPGLPTLEAEVSWLDSGWPAEAEIGSDFDIVFEVTNDEDVEMKFQTLVTRPLTTGPFEPFSLAPGESRSISLRRRVVGLPGVFEPRVTVVGTDGSTAFRADRSRDGSRIRVTRPPLSISLGDTLVAALAPGGEERVRLYLPAGARAEIDAAGPGDPGTSLELLGPDGAPVRRFRRGVSWRARRAGEHTLVLRHEGPEAGFYRLETAGAGVPRPGRIATRAEEDGRVLLPFDAAARSRVELEVSAPRAADARLVSYLSPSGALIPASGAATDVLEEAGQDGTWVAIVAHRPGPHGRVRLRTRATWVAGVETTP